MAELINTNFLDSIIPKSLQVFTCENNQLFIDNKYTYIISPLTGISCTNSDIVFQLNSNNNSFLDLYNSFIEVEFNITEKDGNPIAKPYMIALPTNSLFNQTELYFNGTLISTSSPYFHYESLLQRLLYMGNIKQISEGYQKYYSYTLINDSNNINLKGKLYTPFFL